MQETEKSIRNTDEKVTSRDSMELRQNNMTFFMNRPVEDVESVETLRREMVETDSMLTMTIPLETLGAFCVPRAILR
jgi:hypothetical protein